MGCLEKESLAGEYMFTFESGCACPAGRLARTRQLLDAEPLGEVVLVQGIQAALVKRTASPVGAVLRGATQSRPLRQVPQLDFANR